jgi:hypothetical protein
MRTSETASQSESESESESEKAMERCALMLLPPIPCPLSELTCYGLGGLGWAERRWTWRDKRQRT